MRIRRELASAMYDQQIKSIESKIKELSERANLKKFPRLTRFKGPIPPAYYFGQRNQLGISETLLAEWEKGLLDEQDVDAILAHEIGHAITYQQGSHHYSKAAIHTIVFLLMVTAFALRTLMPSSMLQNLVLFGILITLIIWALCIPWVIRKTYVPSELEADSSAVAFNLVTPQQLVRQMIRAANVSPSTEELSPYRTLEFIWSVLKHPSIADRLRNLNCRIEDIEIQKKTQ